MLIEKFKKIHLIGIGGISLSSLAEFLLKCGITITGSDKNFSEKITYLNELGCFVWVGSHPELIKQPDLVIYSSAIPKTDPELIYCLQNNILTLERKEFLGLLSEKFKYCVAVSGTHGKTTVTALLIKIFAEGKKEFFGHVGGDTKEFGNCYYSGNEFFITEACEYKKSFLSLKPKMGIVLNAECDHPDTYRNIEEVYSAFDEFLKNTRQNNGLCFVCGDTDYSDRLQNPDIVTFGTKPFNRFRADNIYEYKNGYYGFLIYDYSIPLGYIKLPIPGYHNINNALCAFAVGYLSGIPADTVCSAINSFKGIKRRFEYVCKYAGIDVYTDYAHHPSEIKAVIDTAKRISDKKIAVIFQPHTYSRTAKLFDEFLSCFDNADKIVIVKEYSARETSDAGITSSQLFLKLPQKEKVYCDNILDAIVLFNSYFTPDDIVLVIGAGDVVNICDLLKSNT